MYDRKKANFAPDIAVGNAALDREEQHLGLKPSDPGFDATAYLRDTPGYKFNQAEAANAITTNAYAAGLGDSGAAYKALQQRAQSIADNNFNTYLSQITGLANQGLEAKSSIAGISQNYANASNQITQNAANAASGAAQQQGSIWSGALSQLGKLAGNAYQSSYGTPNLLPAGQTPPYAPVSQPQSGGTLSTG